MGPTRNGKWIGVLAALGGLLLAGKAKAEGDLITLIDNIQNITTETFTSTSADVRDGCISPGTHRVLRFGFHSRNVGNGNIVGGAAPAPVCSSCPCSTSPTNGSFTWSNSHCHWHLTDFNTYSLTRGTGEALVNGFKQAFCLMDYNKWDPAAGPGPYNCRNQGVTPGWEDIYESSLPCQFINVDYVGSGDFRLIATTNAAPTVTEANIHNNSVSIPIRIDGNTVSLIGGEWQRRETGSSVANMYVPAVTSWGPNRLDVFWAAGSEVRNTWKQNGSTWAAAGTLGALPNGWLPGTPTAVAWEPGRLDVFVRGGSRLWHKYYQNGWSGWSNTAGVSGMGSDPRTVSWGPDRLDTFWIDTAGNLRHIAWAGTFWGPIDNRGRPSGVTLQGHPRVAAWGVGRLDVVAWGSDDRLWHTWWDSGSGWGIWDNPGGATNVKTPEIVSWGPGRLDIFWASTNSNAIKHIGYQGGWGGISTFAGPSGVNIASWPSATAWGPNRLDVFTTGSDGRLWHAWWDGNAWAYWQSLHSHTDLWSVPQATSWAANQLSIIFGLTGQRFGSAMYF